jgi:hypothetical protein
MIIRRESPFSGTLHEMDLPVTAEQLLELARPIGERRLIQEIFPHLTPAERTFVSSGITPQEWDDVTLIEED